MKGLGKNAKDFKRLERRIEKVAFGQKDPTPKIRDDVLPFTARVLVYPLPEWFRMPIIPTYDGKTNPSDHLDTFTLWILLQGSGQK